MEKNGAKTMTVVQWSAATAVAAITGVFSLVVYTQTSFPTIREFETHKDREVHDGALDKETYYRDRSEIRESLKSINAKLDEIKESLPRR